MSHPTYQTACSQPSAYHTSKSGSLFPPGTSSQVLSSVPLPPLLGCILGNQLLSLQSNPGKPFYLELCFLKHMYDPLCLFVSIKQQTSKDQILDFTKSVTDIASNTNQHSKKLEVN
jgi:hypothetical protein